jgi:hypothetical protein
MVAVAVTMAAEGTAAVVGSGGSGVSGGRGGDGDADGGSGKVNCGSSVVGCWAYHAQRKKKNK